MKKHDEGYALPLVLVVMVVICLISSTILSFSLKNLQSQSASVERMTDKYQAQGEIEKVIAVLEKKNTIVQIEAVSYDDTANILELRAEFNTVIITCKVQLTDITKSQTISEGVYEMSVGTKPVVEYISYEITTTETAPQGEVVG